MNDPGTLAFIGGGNMARSLIGGLLAQGFDPARIRVAEPGDAARAALQHDFGVHVHADAADAVGDAATWVFAVKPQVMRTVCEALAGRVQATAPLLVSIAAGITIAQIERWTGGQAAVVRAMPNTPALLGAGATGLFANARVAPDAHERAQRLLASCGATVWVDDESLIDAVTGVSGSGPAYVFLLAEAMEAAALAQGLAPEAARRLVLQTVLGAARMLTESGTAPAELRRQVTSPGGTTQAAIESFEGAGFSAIVGRAIDAAVRRGGALSAANDDA